MFSLPHCALIQWINDNVMQIRYLDLGMLGKKARNAIWKNGDEKCEIHGLFEKNILKNNDLTIAGLKF